MKIHILARAYALTIEVGTQETILEIKRKIEHCLGVPISSQTLSVCDWELLDGLDLDDYPIVTEGVEMDDDFRKLSDYGVGDFSEIIVFLKTMSRLVAEPPSRKLGFVVQTSSALLGSTCLPVEMKDSSTVTELRELLLGRKLLPHDDYIFIHKQRIMRENCSLRWHGVENGDSLYIFKGTVSRGS
ncbi:uncharacterized protein LOC110906245 isoform X2 [Helianthus annuus]|uniref:uncharacterized protein LOC110906245 isoform X2 n=1 Tax=Helianthus annuus TaxID=4232 RepID=UPI000B9098FB|nr:uncharacterized protein LOC110906245 isoform X2 [Helianthus annuus]